MRYLSTAFIAAAVGAAFAPLGGAEAQSLVFDRGLPDTNLNNVSGANRSNVAWGFRQDGANDFASGDDFVLSSTGDAANPVWEVNTIRMWITAGTAGDMTFNLGDRFLNSQLFVQNGSGPTSLVQSGNFTTGSSATDNADISISRVQYADGSDYQATGGAFAQIWQVEYTNLNLIVNPGDEVRFYAFGDVVDPASGQTWFNHASNAALSGTLQEGADDLYGFLQVDDLTNSGPFDSNGNGWDKSSDINVQVFATAIPAPGTAALVGLAGLVAARRRR